MLFVWDRNDVYNTTTKTYLVCASKGGNFLKVSNRLQKESLASATFLPISSIYEIVRNKEPFITYGDGSIYFQNYDNRYKYIAIKQFITSERYQRGDIVLSFVISERLPGVFLWGAVDNALREATNPSHETKLDLLRLLEAEESQKKVEEKEKWDVVRKQEEQKKQDKQQVILREQQQKEDDERENHLEKARLERENEALKIRLEIENKAKEEANRILAENLRIQQAALEEEARLTREILEMRERIERQDLDATNKTVESIRDLFGRSTEKNK